jgi:hypothetical protein
MEAEFNHLNHATSKGRCGIFSTTNSGRWDTLSRLLAGTRKWIRAYIKDQELADQELDQLERKISAAPNIP